MADYQSRVCLFLVLLSAFITFSSHAFQFTVGGKNGWGLNPSENYNHWAQRLRFQVNDTLLFKYKKRSDSVLVVSKDDYDQCNTGNPILKMDDGDSTFRFDRSGPFFFISGNKSNCGHGEKLIVVVLAVRNHPWSPPPKWSPQSPAPASSPAEGPVYGPSANSTPDGDSPAAVTAAPPPHRSFAAPAWSSPSVVLVSTVSVVLNVCLGGFIISF